LQSKGYAIETAGTVREAHKHLVSHSFDAIVIQAALPDMDLSELVPAMAKTQSEVILLRGSGESGLDTSKRSTGPTAWVYMGRPDDPSELISLIETTLQRKLLAGENLRLCEEARRELADRVRAEICLKKTNEKLEDSVRERTRQLTVAAWETQRNLAQLQAVVQSISDGVVISDPQGNILSMNAAALALHEYEKVEDIRKPAREFSDTFRLHTLDGRLLSVSEWPISRALRQEKFQNLEVRFDRLDTGSTSYRSYDGAPVYDKNGKMVLCVLTLRDITARIRLEQETAAAREEAVRANRAKSRFLANMSHEIRTPLNNMVGMAELLLSSGLTTQQREYMESILSSTDHLLAIINDILDFSKIEAGAVTIQSVALKPRKVVDKTVAAFRLQAESRNVALSHKIDPLVPKTVTGDPVRLREILANLVGNALKFTERGEVTVHVSLKEDGEDGVTLGFRIQDTGIGIPEEDIPQLFSPFTQGDASTTRRHGGTGLGLAITRSLIERMGGEIHVDSKPGEGSMFWFDLKFKHAPGGIVADQEEETAARQKTSASSQAPRLERPLHILVAEDNNQSQTLMHLMLESIGATCEIVSNGKEAVEAWKDRRFDAVLMDCQMPVMDGYEASRAIRDLETAGRKTLIIALTAHAFQEERDKCLDAGMDDHVGKPIRLETLVAALNRWTTPALVQSDSQKLHQGHYRVPDVTLDLNTVEILRKMCGTDRIGFRGMVDSFLQSTRGTLKEIRHDLDQGDYRSIREKAHSVQGSVGMYGAGLLMRLLRELELHSTEQNSETLPPLISSVEKELDHVGQEFQNYLTVER